MPVSDSFSDEYDKTGKALDKALVPRPWKVANRGSMVKIAISPSTRISWEVIFKAVPRSMPRPTISGWAFPWATKRPYR